LRKFCSLKRIIADIITMGDPTMADHSHQPQPVLALGWQRGCGQLIMIFGIGLTVLSGLCTAGMTIVDLSDSGHHGGDINLTGIQYIFGAPFILIGALIWWGGSALRRKHPGAAVPAGRPSTNEDPSDPPRGA
jgi:Na+-transporting NADH:ubiquinone oxidoreductase subunit NqrD